MANFYEISRRHSSRFPNRDNKCNVIDTNPMGGYAEINKRRKVYDKTPHINNVKTLKK